jgi:hypothetical protein
MQHFHGPQAAGFNDGLIRFFTRRARRHLGGAESGG